MLINSMLKVPPAARPDIDTVLRRLQRLISSPSSRQPVVDSKPAQAVTSPRDSALKGVLLPRPSDKYDQYHCYACRDSH